MKLCPYCGTELPDDAKACNNCGRPCPEPAVTEPENKEPVQAEETEAVPEQIRTPEPEQVQKPEDGQAPAEFPSGGQESWNGPQDGWNNSQQGGWNNGQQNSWDNSQQGGWNNGQQGGWNGGQQNGWNGPQAGPYGPSGTMQRSNPFAMASCIFGVVATILNSLLFLPSILAIVFGLIGFMQIRKNPEIFRGKWMAIVGIVMGVICLIVYGIFFHRVYNALLQDPELIQQVQQYISGTSGMFL